MALSKETKERIAKDADEYAHTYTGTKLIKRPYIAGAKVEAGRAEKLVTELKKIEKMAQDIFDPANTPPQIANKIVDIGIALNSALTKYNSTSK